MPCVDRRFEQADPVRPRDCYGPGRQLEAVLCLVSLLLDCG